MSSTPRASGYPKVVLAVLIVAYTFNFLDRQILGILAGPIKAELGLSDSQLGLMGGLAFALFYTGLGVPIAALADRWSRTWIMTGALALWSGFTALCGLATGFWQLFLCRMGVGIGEAGGVAPAYSLISDYFPKEQRARALAAYSFGIPIGSALGILFGGLIAHAVDWRAAFIAVGVAGVALAPIFRLIVKEPPREASPPPAPVAAGAPPAGGVRALLAKPSFWLISLGAAASSVCGYGVAFWLPSFFERSLGMGLVDRSLFLGSMTLVGGVIGVWAGGVLGDRLGRARPAAYLLVPAVAFLLALPCFVLAVQAKTLWVAFILFLIPTGLNLVWLGPVITAVQHLVAPAQRSTASACFLFVNNLIGLGLGTWYFGAISDVLTPRYGTEALRYAIYSGLGFYVVSAVLFVLAARGLKRDWIA
ncbi:MAG: MFS transporter [Phenylobacterium sp. RIFCSPHIGHO2_01_FULL_69_31]|jgi:MFS family permease|uniref:spinster family MFS transporter n=1 Tax=Phenylobacterium sp. RIFCSPHIGHO2_01_FULL_69_31 TaxID=1801944 RepID=UPI0008CF8018|nr:MFS transporter [Phenylobacterium sp. RIFCSPHIGHO2_01_FULL_69_31]OHB26492.1 MAG: MFS transporter [Phenylobacterium sp. RIFCSPHIGHO2_01_FULL_69_31]